MEWRRRFQWVQKTSEKRQNIVEPLCHTEINAKGINKIEQNRKKKKRKKKRG